MGEDARSYHLCLMDVLTYSRLNSRNSKAHYSHMRKSFSLNDYTSILLFFIFRRINVCVSRVS